MIYSCVLQGKRQYNSTLASRRKRLTAHFEDLEQCYFSNKMSRISGIPALSQNVLYLFYHRINTSFILHVLYLFYHRINTCFILAVLFLLYHRLNTCF